MLEGWTWFREVRKYIKVHAHLLIFFLPGRRNWLDLSGQTLWPLARHFFRCGSSEKWLASVGIVMHLLLGAVIDSDGEGYEYKCQWASGDRNKVRWCYSLGLPQVQKTVVTRTNWVESRTPNHVFKSNHDWDQCWGFFLAGKIPTISPIEFCTAFTFEPLNTLGLFSRSGNCTIMTRKYSRPSTLRRFACYVLPRIEDLVGV